MIQFFVVILGLFLSLGNSANVWGQPGMDAIKSLKKIEAKTQMGTSYDDYVEELANTKSEVNLFMASTDAKSDVKLSEAMNKAMEHYEFAKLVWERAKKRKELESELLRLKQENEWNPIDFEEARRKALEQWEKEKRQRYTGESPYYLDKNKDSDTLQEISTRYLNNSPITSQKTHVDKLLPIILRQASKYVEDATIACYEKAENNLVTGDSTVPRPRKSRSKTTKPPLGWSPPVFKKIGGK